MKLMLQERFVLHFCFVITQHNEHAPVAFVHNLLYNLLFHMKIFIVYFYTHLHTRIV